MTDIYDINGERIIILDGQPYKLTPVYSMENPHNEPVTPKPKKSAPRLKPEPAKKRNGFKEQVLALLAKGMSAPDVASRVGCSEALVYNYKKKR